MKSLVKFVAFIFILGLVGVLGIATYLGFVPGLSNAFGTNMPINLGITYSEKEFSDFQTKAKSILVYEKTIPNGKSIAVTGKLDVDNTFTQQELSARLNYSKWKNMPITNTQIKIEDDGTVQFSGNLQIDKLSGFISEIAGGNYSQKDVDEALSYLSKLGPNPPVYIKFSASAKNNKSTINLQDLKIGRLAIPVDKFGDVKLIEQTVDQALSIYPGFFAQSVSFADGKMSFKGTVPEKVTILSD